MRRFTSIRSILLLSFTLCLLLPSLIIFVYAQSVTGNALAEQAINQQIHEVTLQAQHIEQGLTQIREDAAYLSQLRSLRLRQHDGTLTDALEQDLAIFATTKPMIQRLLLTRYDQSIGLDNSSATPRTIDADVLSSEAYYALLQPYLSLATGEVSISFELVWDTPVLRYVLGLDDGIIMLDVQAAWVLRNMPDVEANRIWAIINQQGHHLLFPLPDEAYTGALVASDEALAPYVPQFEADSGAIEAASNILIYSHIRPAGRNNTYWSLYQQMPRADLDAVVNDFYRSSAIILLIAIVVTAIISLTIARQIVQPVRELQQKVRNFARSERVTKASKRVRIAELRDLHESFYLMATQLASERQQKRQLIKQLINAQEDERKRIAYDLHDGLIQQLVVARMYTAMIKDAPRDAAAETIQESEQALKTAIVEGRRIIEGLHPTTLDDLGLVDAIDEMVHQQALRYDWQLNLALEPLSRELDKTITITLFRIIQEALNNIAKHADANRVQVQLRIDAGIHLLVEDDGKGFDTQASNFSMGFGIGTMCERASTLGGTCHIASQPALGTSITVFIPLN